MSKVTPTSRRKSDHIRVNLEEDVQSGLTTGLEKLRFEHRALPEIDFHQIDTTTSFFGKDLSAPLLISSMTGGSDEAHHINLALAEAAQETQIAMALGSLRAAIEQEDLSVTFQVREVAPGILLFANLGAVQLNYGYGPSDCQRAVDLVGADALILHLNLLQEALQPEGQADFSSLLPKIEAVCSEVSVPVVAKEVGWGIDRESARRLVEAGVAAIDVAGAGGTSWAKVEMYRAENERQARLAGAFANWGIPTAECLAQVREALPNVPLIASGGLRSGIDIAKCIALGADLGALAGPFLEAATLSSEVVVETIEDITLAIRIAMFATGSADLEGLRRADLVPAS